MHLATGPSPIGHVSAHDDLESGMWNVERGQWVSSQASQSLSCAALKLRISSRVTFACPDAALAATVDACFRKEKKEEKKIEKGVQHLCQMCAHVRPCRR